MPGYSGTPLAKKLGIRENDRVRFSNLPASVKAELKAILSRCQLSQRSPLDFAMVFTDSADELRTGFPVLASQLAPAGMLWVSWPKKSSGVKTDLNENLVRQIGLDAGLVDVKVCAVTEVWSGLKFVIRLKDRK